MVYWYMLCLFTSMLSEIDGFFEWGMLSSKFSSWMLLNYESWIVVSKASGSPSVWGSF
jgi:hypothetical protein